MFRRKNWIKLSVITILSGGLFIGCGGSSSSGSNPPNTNTTSGIVSGSFYAGATVCFDTNNDGSCSGEETVASASDGSFTLDGKAIYNIVADLNGATKHEVVGDVGTPAPNNKFRIPKEAVDSVSGKFIISGISTKLWDEMEQNSSLTFDQAKSKVATKFGIDKDKLLRNFNDSSLDANTRAKLQSETENIENLMATHGDINAAEIRSYVSTFSLPEQIDPLAQ
jgi:acid phosphatase